MPSPMDHADRFLILDKRTQVSHFGPEVMWEDGLEFQCLLTFNSGRESLSAEQLGVNSMFSGMAEIGAPIKYNAVVKRISDDSTFRVASDPEDDKTPATSSFQVKNFALERYDLPES